MVLNATLKQYFSTRCKLPTCRKSLTNFCHIVLYQVHPARAGFELTTLVTINPYDHDDDGPSQ